MPHVSGKADPETAEFLKKVADILVDYVLVQNDREEKILDFHHPEEMLELLDMNLTKDPVSLQQLVVDCANTLKYQVKTGTS